MRYKFLFGELILIRVAACSASARIRISTLSHLELYRPCARCAVLFWSRSLNLHQNVKVRCQSGQEAGNWNNPHLVHAIFNSYLKQTNSITTNSRAFVFEKLALFPLLASVCSYSHYVVAKGHRACASPCCM